MAEYLFNARKISGFRADSAATSSWEEGNPVHIGTKKILNSLGIDCSAKRARKITRADYDNYDYIIGMDATQKRKSACCSTTQVCRATSPTRGIQAISKLRIKI